MPNEKIYKDLDGGGNGQLIGWSSERLVNDPIAPTVGQIWFNTTDGVEKTFDGVVIKTTQYVGDAGVINTEDIADALFVRGRYIPTNGSVEFPADAVGEIRTTPSTFVTGIDFTGAEQILITFSERLGLQRQFTQSLWPDGPNDGQTKGLTSPYDTWHVNTAVSDVTTGTLVMQEVNTNARLISVLVMEKRTIKVVIGPNEIEVDKTGLLEGDVLTYDATNDKMIKGTAATGAIPNTMRWQPNTEYYEGDQIYEYNPAQDEWGFWAFDSDVTTGPDDFEGEDVTFLGGIQQLSEGTTLDITTQDIQFRKFKGSSIFEANNTMRDEALVPSRFRAPFVAPQLYGTATGKIRYAISDITGELYETSVNIVTSTDDPTNNGAEWRAVSNPDVTGGVRSHAAFLIPSANPVQNLTLDAAGGDNYHLQLITVQSGTVGGVLNLDINLAWPEPESSRVFDLKIATAGTPLTIVPNGGNFINEFDSATDNIIVPASRKTKLYRVFATKGIKAVITDITPEVPVVENPVLFKGIVNVGTPLNVFTTVKTVAGQAIGDSIDILFGDSSTGVVRYLSMNFTSRGPGGGSCDVFAFPVGGAAAHITMQVLAGGEIQINPGTGVNPIVAYLKVSKV